MDGRPTRALTDCASSALDVLLDDVPDDHGDDRSGDDQKAHFPDPSDSHSTGPRKLRDAPWADRATEPTELVICHELIQALGLH
jgi:hypothetical protein